MSSVIVGKEIAPSINRNTGLVTDSNKLPKKPIFSAHATDTLNMSELQNALIAFQDQRKLTQQQTDLIRQFQNLLQMRQTQPQLKPVDHIKAGLFLDALHCVSIQILESFMLRVESIYMLLSLVHLVPALLNV